MFRAAWKAKGRTWPLVFGELGSCFHKAPQKAWPQKAAAIAQFTGLGIKCAQMALPVLSRGVLRPVPTCHVNISPPV